MALRELTDDTFDEVVRGSDRPVLVEFAAEWCQPCRAMARVLGDVAAAHADQLVVGTVDVDRNPVVMSRHAVMGTPTLVLFVDGEPRRRMVGARGKGRLLEELAGWL